MNTQTSAGRNEPCPCGSGRKYKHCCMDRDRAEQTARQRLHLPGIGKRADLEGAQRELLSDDWELEIFPFPGEITDDPAARPVAVLVGSGPIVVHANVWPNAPAEPDKLALLLDREVQQAVESLGRAPRRVDTRFRDLTAALGPLLSPRGIDVRLVRELSEMSDAARHLVAHLTGVQGYMLSASHPATWAGWSLARDQIARLFRASAAFHRAAPWRIIGDDKPLRATTPGGGEWYVMVLGNAGQEFGVALYSDMADIDDLFSAPDARSAVRDMRGYVVSVTFDPKGELPPPMRREIREAGWEIAGPSAYPMLMVLGTPGGGVTERQIEDLIAVLLAMPRFVDFGEHGRAYDGTIVPASRWTDDDTGIVFESSPLAIEDAESHWEVPDRLAPCMPEGSGARPEATLRDESDDAREALLRDTVNGFEQYLRTDGHGRGVSETTEEEHSSVAFLFVSFLTGYQDIPPAAVTEYDLREFLYGWYPRKVLDSETSARSVCGSLRRFFEYLEVEGVRCPWAAAIVRDQDAFLARWKDFSSIGDDESAENWRVSFTEDLERRVFIPASGPIGGIEWGALAGQAEAALYDELLRMWLRWRDEIIHAGTTEPDAVFAELCSRQRVWASAPNAGAGGKAPARVVAREQARFRKHFGARGRTER